jgi:hypothetical protein
LAINEKPLCGKELGMTLVTDYDVPSPDPKSGTLDRIKMLVDERRQILRGQDRKDWLNDMKRIREIDQELSQLWQRRRSELQ